jgi:hypothetical protein
MPRDHGERNDKLTRAWDFLELWQERLTRPDGEQQLPAFYAATTEFLLATVAADLHAPADVQKE